MGELLREDISEKENNVHEADRDMNKLQEKIKEKEKELREREKDLKDAKEKKELLMSMEKTNVTLTKAKDALQSKMNMVLNQLKQKDKELNKMAEDNENLLKSSEELKAGLASKDKVENELAETKLKLTRLIAIEQEFIGTGEEALPWETDDDCKEMKAVQLLEIFKDELNFREKVLLYDRCVSELRSEVQEK